MRDRVVRAAVALSGWLAAAATAAGTPPMQPDIPPSFAAPTGEWDYVKREVMIPMRDGVKLHTVIVLPQGAQHAPIILTRTPYNAANRAERIASPHMLATLPMGDEVLVPKGYIRVFQDVRGKYGSEGDYVMTRPLRGPLNATAVDHSTDAYDTIDWLVKNVPESNGKVGMIGSSYEGFTVLMALINPHPALKAAVPMSPMVDGWKGDDWFHNGAFRQTQLRLPLRPDHRARRGQAHRARRLRRLRAVPRAARPATSRAASASMQLPFFAQAHRAPGLRSVLERAGARQDPRAHSRSRCRRCT